MRTHPTKPTPHLKKLNLRDSTIELDAETGAEVYHTRDPHALIQASGYLKYSLGSHGKAVFFRGQTKNHSTLSPGLYRGCSQHHAQGRREAALKRLLADAASKSKLISKVAPDVREPLLQHYGLKTTWIDLVDNIWVALWVACHQATATGKHCEFLHFERRLPRKEDAAARFAYVLMVAADNQPSTSSPGRWCGPATEVVDLRVAAPSVFLRPHAQHAVLFRLRGNLVRRSVTPQSA